MISEIRDSRDSVLAELVDQITGLMQVGEPVDVDSLAREHPELADRLRELLPTLQLLYHLKQESQGSGAVPDSNGERHAGVPGSGVTADNLADRTLGDFRIVREVGRGGMGVVYEAEQISLGRTVRSRCCRLPPCWIHGNRPGSAMKPARRPRCTIIILFP